MLTRRDLLKLAPCFAATIALNPTTLLSSNNYTLENAYEDWKNQKYTWIYIITDNKNLLEDRNSAFFINNSKRDLDEYDMRHCYQKLGLWNNDYRMNHHNVHLLAGNERLYKEYQKDWAYRDSEKIVKLSDNIYAGICKQSPPYTIKEVLQDFESNKYPKMAVVWNKINGYGILLSSSFIKKLHNKGYHAAGGDNKGNSFLFTKNGNELYFMNSNRELSGKDFGWCGIKIFEHGHVITGQGKRL